MPHGTLRPPPDLGSYFALAASVAGNRRYFVVRLEERFEDMAS
jgi:hypothetical protein